MVYPTPYAAQRPMPQQMMNPAAGFSPHVAPQAPPRNMMAPPASQPLVPQNMGMGLDPQQMAALQSQMTPEVMQQVNAMMQDPQVQAQLQKLEQMAKNGQLTPEMLQQTMGSMPLPAGAMPGMLPLPSVLGSDFSPTQWIRNSLIGVGIGLISGTLLDRLMEGAATNQSSLLERFLKRIESIPGVETVNRWLNKKFAEGRKLPAGTESTWLRMDGHYNADQVIENLYKSYLGPNGHITADLGRMNVPQSIVTRLTANTRNPAELTRLLSTDLSHFLPESAREIAQGEILGGSRLASIQDTLSKWLPKGLINPPKPSAVTLKQLDRLVDKHHFTQFIAESLEKRAISGETAGKVLELLNTYTAGPKTHAGDAFAELMEKLVNADNKSVRTLLGLTKGKNKIGYDAIQTALKAQTGGRQSIFQTLKEATKGLLTHNFADTEYLTLGQAQNHLKQTHLMEQWTKMQPKEAKRLQSTLSGLLKRTSYINNHYRTLAEGEHALARALEKKSIGPVGRFLGKIGYYMQRTLDGANLRMVQGKAVTTTTKGLPIGRAIISLFVFGLAIGAYCKNTITDSPAPKTGPDNQPAQKPSTYLRVTRFLDTLANGLGGYMGFEIGRSFIPQLRLLTQTPALAKFCNKAIFGFLPFTYGGFISEMLIPGLMGAAVAYPVQKLINLVIGDPHKIEKQEQFEADKNRPFTSQRGILEGFAKGDIPKVPGVVPGIQAIAPSKEALTPQNVGLSPEQISYNPSSTTYNEGLAKLTQFLQTSPQKTIWSYGSH